MFIPAKREDKRCAMCVRPKNRPIDLWEEWAQWR
jgi:hypothetical protein